LDVFLAEFEKLKLEIFMNKPKPKLSVGIAIRLPEHLVLELRESAIKEHRTISQEIRYRLDKFCSGSEANGAGNKLG
jgi:hypothetical protein